MPLEEILKVRIKQLLIVGACLATLVITPTRNFDGVLLGKHLAISTFSFALIVLVAWPQTKLLSTIPKSIRGFGILFFAWLLLAILFSGAPFNQQIWGVFGRNSGAITYLCLWIALIAGGILQSYKGYRQIVLSFLAVSTAISIYALVQIAGVDPIGWSEKRTFATLGNVNFLSAFLGMVCVSLFSLTLSSRFKTYYRVLFLALLLVDLWIISSTDSIQGIMVFAAGAVVAAFIKLRENIRLFRILGFPYIIFSLGFLVLVIMALTNNGPLARYIFQISIILRGDYIHAGIEMMLKKPLFGVGFDSYGNWYREMRGEKTTLFGSPDRVANTAHNIFVDMGANGGLILAFAFLGVNIATALYVVRALRNVRSYDPIFVSILGAWVGYLVQGLVSINHITVSFWGWMFQGCLLGYVTLMTEKTRKDGSAKTEPAKRDSKSKKEAKRMREIPQLPPALSLCAIIVATIGFVTYWIPLSADAAYKKATRTGDLISIERSTAQLGATQFHRELALEFAMRQKLPDEARRIASEIIQDYPRSFYAWQIIAATSPSGSDQRLKALQRLKQMDPFNPEIPKS